MSSRSSISAANARAARKPRKAKPRSRKSPGIPPPVQFDLSKLPDDALLASVEVAAYLRKSVATVSAWRQNPNHALVWERVPPDDGVPRYRAGNLRRYMAGKS
jgi:hypothetical protein